MSAAVKAFVSAGLLLNVPLTAYTSIMGMGVVLRVL
jgi:hypothetical protein